MEKASLILYLFDLSSTSLEEIEEQEKELKKFSSTIIKVGNKSDKADTALLKSLEEKGFVLIAASQKTNIEALKEKILEKFHFDKVKQGDVLVTNLRHYENLKQTFDALTRVLEGMDNGVTGDFLAMDIRQSLHYLGEITGTITTDDLLDNIFSKFCIGK
jgi:tRNA modification GTPase